MCQAGPDYRRGNQHPGIAIVGACPGAREETENRPFIGPAGANLAMMVSIINGISPAKFPSVNRDDYTLLNAHPLPRYADRAGYDGNTEPSQAEVMNEKNIARLAKQLGHTAVSRVLLAGLTPQWLTQTIVADFAGTEIFWCGHPSFTAWNTRYVGQRQADKLRNWTKDTFKMVEPFHVIA